MNNIFATQDDHNRFVVSIPPGEKFLSASQMLALTQRANAVKLCNEYPKVYSTILEHAKLGATSIFLDVPSDNFDIYDLANILSNAGYKAEVNQSTRHYYITIDWSGSLSS